LKVPTVKEADNLSLLKVPSQCFEQRLIKEAPKEYPEKNS
jgi:hypothetical protein